MENAQVSEHEVRVYRALCSGKWMTATQVADATKVNPRTVRHHCRRLRDLGMLDVAEVFPGPRYRVSDHAKERHSAYVRRLEAAAVVMGVTDES